jgi:hypothetical protein
MASARDARNATARITNAITMSSSIFLETRRAYSFSPIAHTHGIAMCGGIDPLDHEFSIP